MEPTPKPIDYATPARPKPIEGPLGSMMMLACWAAIGQILWGYLDLALPVFDGGPPTAIDCLVLLLPSLVAWLMSTTAYYQFERRNLTALIFVQSLVGIYAGLVFAAKYSGWRHWYRP